MPLLVPATLHKAVKSTVKLHVFVEVELIRDGCQVQLVSYVSLVRVINTGFCSPHTAQ